MKVCEACGSTKGKVYGKTGKYKMDLCGKHREQMRKFSEISERTIYSKNEIVINGDVLEIILYNNNCVEVAVTLVSAVHYDLINSYKWGLGSDGYAITTIKGKTCKLHRLI